MHFSRSKIRFCPRMHRYLIFRPRLVSQSVKSGQLGGWEGTQSIHSLLLSCDMRMCIIIVMFTPRLSFPIRRFLINLLSFEKVNVPIWVGGGLIKFVALMSKCPFSPITRGFRLIKFFDLKESVCFHCCNFLLWFQHGYHFITTYDIGVKWFVSIWISDIPTDDFVENKVAIFSKDLAVECLKRSYKN